MTGCSSKSSFTQKDHEKAFDQEDFYILAALRLEQLEDYNSSSGLFNILYEESNKKEYLYRSLKNDLAANENERAIQRIDAAANNSMDDFELLRIKIVALIKLERLTKAKDLAIALVEKSNIVDDYLLVSEIYVKLKKFDTALKYLESAYVKNYNEKILDKMSIILYVNLQRKTDAIAQLETHSRIHGCSAFICAKLIGFYSDENNIDGLLSTYLRLYKVDPNKDIAKKIVQIYGYKKDYTKMTDFLQESKTDDELLLQLYIQAKNYKKASPLANELYKENGDITYLGQSAIFEYEGSENKRDEVMQKSVISKLKDVIEIKKEGIYLNYLGYLLIDNDIDVKQGIKYVNEALVLEPDSAYYLDSLAWGYYKLGECQKARKIMDKVIKMDGSSNEEVIQHVIAIKKCKTVKKGKK
jgi:predicted Zn-dependent protease